MTDLKHEQSAEALLADLPEDRSDFVLTLFVGGVMLLLAALAILILIAA